MKIYKIKDTTGDINYVEANRVSTDSNGKVINLYSKDMLVFKIPIDNLMYMGVVGGEKDEFDTELSIEEC